MGLNLESTISLNSASFERGMNRVVGSVSSVAKQMVVGAIGVYAIEKAIFSTIETSKELVNESKRMGVTVEQLQVMRKAASGANVEMDALATTMEKLNTFRGKALGGGADSAMALKQASQLGITPQMLKQSNAQDILFNVIGKKIKEVNPQDIAAPLREVLGRGYGQLIPLLTKDMDALQKKMESLGMIISSKTAYELKEFDTQLNSVKNILVSVMAPALVGMAEFILDTFTGSGIIGQAVEGLIFKIDELTGRNNLASVNGFSATDRAEAAAYALDLLSKSITDNKGEKNGKLKTVSDFNRLVEEASRQSLTPDDRKMPITSGIFSDMKASTPSEIKAYLSSLIQPVADVVSGASKASGGTMDGLRASIKSFKDSYKNFQVKPVDFEGLAGAQAHGGRIESDSRVMVGNFLGSNTGAVHAAARMEQHSATSVALLRSVNNTLQKIQVQLPKAYTRDPGHWSKDNPGAASINPSLNQPHYDGIMSLFNVPN